ncbi:MAG: damage-control phosphatase ARMT1 family protein [Candidatus Brocadiia bacterium]
MQAAAECIPCVLSQALAAARRVTDDPWLHRKLLFALMEHLPRMNFDRTPAEVSFDAMGFVAKYLGVADPFKEDKALHTARMLEAEQDMRRDILAADDPLRAAIQFALAGNMMDLGVLQAEPIERELARDARDLCLAIDDYMALRHALAQARTLLYLLDNAGEVVCDKLVVELLEVPEVTCVVRAAPIINDVTREDIEPVGLGRLAEIVDVGAETLGVPLSHCSAGFRERFAAADVVISKGQANFETLDEADRDVFHILRAKCRHVARHLGVPRGAPVLVRTPREAPDHDDRSERPAIATRK